MLERVAEFSGVEVLTFAVMNNHFHLLVRIPEPPELTDVQLIQRYHTLYRDQRSTYQPTTAALAEILRTGDSEATHWRKRLRSRMCDVGEFMKTLKQRFTTWYNHTHGRFGTLWAERYKCLVVEASIPALTTVAAYIDLNPVRAGLAQDPAEYRWCGYAEAMGGAAGARRGLAGLFLQSNTKPGKALADYRRILFFRGSIRKAEQGRIPSDKAAVIMRKGGKVPISEAIRFRLRYLSDGLAIGSRAFVAKVLADDPKEPVPLDLPFKTDETLAVARKPRGPAIA